MNKRAPLLVGGTLFGLVALVHLLRLIYHWDVVIDGQVIPQSVSVLGLIVPGLLSVWMFISARKN